MLAVPLQLLRRLLAHREVVVVEVGQEPREDLLGERLLRLAQLTEELFRPSLLALAGKSYVGQRPDPDVVALQQGRQLFRGETDRFLVLFFLSRVAEEFLRE